MNQLTSTTIVKQLHSSGFKVFEANNFSEGINVSFSEGLNQFIELAADLKVQHFFINKLILTDEDIEDSLISEEMIFNKNIPDEFIDELNRDVTKFNNKTRKLKEFVGFEQQIELFFVNSGAVFSFETRNPNLFPDDPDEFLDSILENNEDKIKEKRNKERLERQIVRHKIMSELEPEIIAHEHFKTCTNDNNRRNFAFTLYDGKEDFFNNNKIGVYEIIDFIGVLWSKHKDNFKKK